MNGNRYFLDTNALISLLQGNESLRSILMNAQWIGTSVVSVLEFLSFPDLSLKDKALFFLLIERIELIGIESTDISHIENLAAFKIETSLKLPDAIIAAYAIKNRAILISNDRHFEGISKLSLQKF